MTAARCFVDLDGVLADFHAGAVRQHGRPYPDPWPAGVWHVHRVLGLEEAAFWAPLDEAFWAGLGPTPDCAAILALVERLFGPANVCVLSSPSRDPWALSGKYRWILRHLPAYDRRFLIGPAKHFCAGPGAVLVDDSDAYVAAFTAAGGRAALVARPWNSKHALPPADRLADLESALRAALPPGDPLPGTVSG